MRYHKGELYTYEHDKGGGKMGPTLPVWIWIIYYAFFLTVCILSIYHLMKGGIHKFLSSLNLVLVPLVIIATIVFALKRSGVNEITFFWNQLITLDIFAIIILLLFMYFIFYVGLSIRGLSK